MAIPAVDVSFVPTRKGINISQLYTTLADLRAVIQFDDDYEKLYLKILRNMSKTKKLRLFIFKEFNLKLSIGKIQNLVSFTLCCYNLAKSSKKGRYFAHCLLPPRTSDYLPWQRAITGMLKARKTNKCASLMSMDYEFRNDLKLSRYEVRDGYDSTDTESTSSLSLPSLMPCKSKSHSEYDDGDPLTQSGKLAKISKRSSGELPMLVWTKWDITVVCISESRAHYQYDVCTILPLALCLR